ncbi:MAG TPA: site-specific integrase [Acidimicrobiales bacterium]|nr:site-specific integrase [Acidimicrobiales bacterium]
MIALYTAPEPDPRQQPLAAFLAEALAAAGQAQIKNCGIAAVQFNRFLRRPAVVADLTTDSIADFATWLVDRGKQSNTANRYAECLVRLGRLAGERSLLDLVPTFGRLSRHGQRRAAFTAAEIERLLAAAVGMPGDVAGVPAGTWWPAFLLTALNTQLAAAALIELPADAFAPPIDKPRAALGAATLRAAGLVYWLHPHTAAALSALHAAGGRRPGASTKLFPWPGSARKPIEMLLYHFQALLRAAGVASQRGAAFDRLRLAIADGGSAVLDRLDVARIAAEQLAIRARAADAERRLAEARAQRRQASKREAQRRRDARNQTTAAASTPARQIVTIRALDPERTLQHVFDCSYLPLRLSRSPRTAQQMRLAIARFQDYLGCEPTIEQLTEDRLEHFAAWGIASGRAPATVNMRIGQLVALANFAWKKRKTDYQIREVPRIKEPKRAPRAWTVAELGLILRSAAAESGTVGGIPACDWWVGLLLVMYDTGLRAGAATALRSADLKPPYILARAESSKSKADQIFKLSADALSLLAETRPPERELLFPHGHAPEWPFRRLRSIIRRAGFECGRRDLFHKLRRTSASYLALVAGKAAAQDHLGHSGPKVTAAYLDPTITESATAADLLPRPTWRPEKLK